MTILNYNGVNIELTPGGKFRATIAGKVTDAPSFEAMKRKIEKAEVFEPFKAFYLESWGLVRNLEVIGIRKNPRFKRHGDCVPRFEWITVEHGDRKAYHSAVYRDTPENRAAVDAWKALVKANDTQRDAMRKAEREAERAIPTDKPDPLKVAVTEVAQS